MADEDIPRDPPPPVERVPDTDHFQVLLGPGGECRIVLLNDAPTGAVPIATLTLGAEAADELSRVLTTRREAHAQAQREEQGGAKH